MYFYSRNNFVNDFFLLLIVIIYSIFYISFSQEEQIHDFFAFTSHTVCVRVSLLIDSLVGMQILCREEGWWCNHNGV